MRRLFAICFLFWPISGAGLAQTTEPEHRLWLLWERISKIQADCPPNVSCSERHEYLSRLIDTPEPEDVDRTLGLLDRLAAARGMAADHPDAPRICNAYDAEVVLGFDPEALEIADKLEALRGLEGVHFSVASMRGPLWYTGNFGADLQSDIERRFHDAGIKILSEQEMITTPGQPKLNIYFSNTNPDTGCHYSVFASLSQTVLLTRNRFVKLSAGTWGMSAGPDPDAPEANEYDAIMRVITRFIEDYREANKPRPS